MNEDLIAGSIYKSKNHGLMEVVKYESYKMITVKFLNTGTVKIAQGGAIRRGTVKDEMAPTVCGVGFIGVGRFKAKEGGRNTVIYNCWSNMINRCYSDDYQSKFPTYRGCKVHDDWLNFQKFAEFYEENHPDDGKAYHLDKDILIEGNKIYSPDTCIFVTANENVMHVNSKRIKSCDFKSPSGDTVSISNLNEFCRDNNLSASNMNSVKNGKRKSHKGWTKA